MVRTLKKLLVLFFVFHHPLISKALEKNTNNVSQDSTLKKTRGTYFELSIGQTLLFISDSRLELIKKQTSIRVPTNAILLFAELRPRKKVKIPIFLNLPTQTKQFIVNGQLFYERASPTFGTGLEFSIFKVKITQTSSFEFEIGPLASFLISENGVLRFAPVGAARCRFAKSEDFIIYFGSIYSVGVDAFGMMFGVGYVF